MIHLPRSIKTAFGGDLLATFGHEANDFRFHFQGELHDFGELAISKLRRVLISSRELENIAVLNMAAVLAKVRSDSVCSGGFADQGGLDGVGFTALFAFVACLPEGATWSMFTPSLSIIFPLARWRD